MPSTNVAIPSDAIVDWAAFVDAADRIAPAFDAATRDLALVNSSLLFSDGLCVCAMSELCDVDWLVEAGTGLGGSTEMCARFFRAGARDRQIWSIDLASTRWSEFMTTARLRPRDRHLWPSRRNARAAAAARLSAFQNVTLAWGDAMHEVPRMVEQLVKDERSVGVLIDGPKEAPQLQLAESLLAMSPLVRFVAVDDIGPRYDAEGRHDRFRGSSYAAFATSDPEYVARYRWLDRDRLPDYMRSDPAHRGCGLGMLVNR